MNIESAAEIVKEISSIFEKKNILLHLKRKKLSEIANRIFYCNEPEKIVEMGKILNFDDSEVSDFISFSYLGLVSDAQDRTDNILWFTPDDIPVSISYEKTFLLNEDELFERLKVIHCNFSFHTVAFLRIQEERISIPHIRLLISPHFCMQGELLSAFGLKLESIKKNFFRLSEERNGKRSFEKVLLEGTEFFSIFDNEQFEKNKALLFSNDLNLSLKEIGIANIAFGSSPNCFSNALLKLLYTDEVITSLILECRINN